MHEEQSRFRRSLARWAVVVHGNGAPGPDLDLHDGKLSLDDSMPRAATNTHPVDGARLHVRSTERMSRSEVARAPTRRADVVHSF